MPIKFNQVILDKLKKNRTELSKKIDLSLVDDIDSSEDYFMQSYDEAQYGADFLNEWIDKINDFNTELSIAVDNYILNGAARNLEEEAEVMREYILKLESVANDLGVNPDELIRNYAGITEALMNSDNVEERFRSAYEELLYEANERFGLSNFMK
jgi:hypothetical protein